tara:strand:+ start:796 stop:1608 length:813 start_codon:yes stop_codon:yes gene_type:complete
MTKLDFSKTAVMAIVNVTPDSFSDGGQFVNYDRAMKHIELQIAAGADIIDIGAQSTRPGAKLISVQEEIKRLTPVLKAYKQHFDVPLSLDTMVADVAAFGLEHGVDLINDVSGFTYDQQLVHVCAQGQVAVCVMHMQGQPATMQQNPVYDNVTVDVKLFLQQQVLMCQAHGIKQIIIDPGIGFGKTLNQNLQLLNQLDQFKQLGCPILLGTSRKSFIDAIAVAGVDQRLGGTVASVVLAWQQGVQLFRVHDVFEVKQALKVAQAITEGVC